MAAVAQPTPLNAEALFDAVGPAYEQAFATCEPQAASIQWLLSQLSTSANINKPATCLDIGSGTGRPVCSSLAAAGHHVTGIDVSGAMVDAARKNVPTARFEKMDIAEFQAAPESFDAVTIYFSLIASVTPAQIRETIRRVYSWLRPGGFFVFATVPLAAENMQIQWCGKPIVVSSLDPEDAVASVKSAGFEVVFHETSMFMPRSAEAGICKADEVWEEPHIFVYARKPA